MEENKIGSRWISVNNIVKSAMLDMGESTPNNYNRYLSWIIRGVNELGYDVFKRFKEVLLKVDTSTYTALLPNDYVQQVRVGLINTNGEYLPFTYNPNIVFDVEVPACHCDCGCTSEICETITEENVEQTDVVIATPVVQCDYSVTLLVSQQQGVCGNPIFPLTVTSITIDGFTTTMNTVVANGIALSALQRSYQISSLPMSMVTNGINANLSVYLCTKSLSYYPDYPLTINSYVKNGVTVLDGTIVANLSALDAYMATLGWARTASTPDYVITNSTDTWSEFNIEGATITGDQQVVVLNSSCTAGVPQWCDYSYDLSGIGLSFPLTIQIAIDGYTLPFTPYQVNSQADLDAFFSGYGFTKSSDTLYYISESINVFSTLIVNCARSFDDSFNNSFG